MTDKQKFDKHFEEKIIQSLLVDEQFAQQMMDVIELRYFDLSYTTRLAEILIDHYKNYETFPTINLLESIVNREEKDDLLKKQCLGFLANTKKKQDFNDLEYVKDKSLSFFRVKNFYRVLEDDVLPLLQRAEIEDGNYLEEVSSIVQKAIVKGADRDIGYDYIADDSERFKEENIEKIKTPWPIMNAAFRGGLERKRLVALIGGTGSGKSQCAINIAAQCLKDGYNVVYYNMEMPLIDLSRRMDSCISGVSIDNIVAEKDKILKHIKDNIPENVKFVIKSYPTKGASVETIKNHLMQLKVQGIIPDVIIVDYANLLKASINDNERRNNIEDIWLSLKGLSQETNTLVISPIQSNREGFKEDYIRPEHVADCFAVMHHADVVFTIQIAGKNQSLGYGKAYIGKNRLGPTGGLYFYQLDGDVSKVNILEMTEELEESIEYSKMTAESKKQQGLADSIKKQIKN